MHAFCVMGQPTLAWALPVVQQPGTGVTLSGVTNPGLYIFNGNSNLHYWALCCNSVPFAGKSEMKDRFRGDVRCRMCFKTTGSSKSRGSLATRITSLLKFRPCWTGVALLVTVRAAAPMDAKHGVSRQSLFILTAVPVVVLAAVVLPAQIIISRQTMALETAMAPTYHGRGSYFNA